MFVIIVAIFLSLGLAFRFGMHIGKISEALDIHNKYYDELPDDFETYLNREAFDRPIIPILERAKKNKKEEIIEGEIKLPKNVIRMDGRIKSSKSEYPGPYKKS